MDVDAMTPGCGLFSVHYRPAFCEVNVSVLCIVDR